MFLAHPLRRVEDVLLQGMGDRVGLPQLTALQREQAALPHRHGGMGLRRFNEDVATTAWLSSAALACAALADGVGKGDPVRGAAELNACVAVESLHRTWPPVKGLANSPDDPRVWARCGQAETTLRMPGVQHAVTHVDADARAAAVFATLEVDAAGQASQLRAAALSDMSHLRSCAGDLASARLTARPGLAELTALEFRTNALLHLRYGRGIGARLAPLQVGVGTPGGTETVAHALASALAEDPETVVISVDMANAFNSIHRAAMLAAVQQSAPALLPMVQWAYRDETPLHIVGAPEGTPPVMSQRGVRQGPGSAIVRSHAAACAGAGSCSV